MSEKSLSGTQNPKQTENKHWYGLWLVMIVLEMEDFSNIVKILSLCRYHFNFGKAYEKYFNPRYPRINSVVEIR